MSESFSSVTSSSVEVYFKGIPVISIREKKNDMFSLRFEIFKMFDLFNDFSQYKDYRH